MVRKSNLVQTSAKNFDPRKQLCRNNVIVYSDYLLVKMEWSKTIQFGNRKLELPLVKIKDSPLCPYNAYNRNPAYWHGYPDIQIDRSTVKVDINESCCETEETQEYEWPEPVAKKQRLLEQTNGAGGEGSILTLKPDIFTTCVEVKKDQFFKTEKAIRQSFAQTITNAFYQVKQKPKLQSLCIPSFLASDNKVRIIMYNCEQDRLYISEDMYLFDTLCDHGLNVGTIVSIWLALNFENFQNGVDEEDLTAIALKKSSFQEKLPDTVLSVYKHQLYRPLPRKRKQTEQPPRTTLGVRLLKSKYAKSLLESSPTGHIHPFRNVKEAFRKVEKQPRA
ncbi:unnamed protein product [Mytilus coruscus]|uniref:Uncharacterized protein n=1 Tax=Mytilus coruscus TaxID=42192 RepID=A0A6J8EI16_MYTCO|nr:unnamed protein product [Mytilus coruscus]